MTLCAQLLNHFVLTIVPEMIRAISIFALTLLCGVVSAAEPIGFFKQICLKCHDVKKHNGDVRLDLLSLQCSNSNTHNNSNYPLLLCGGKNLGLKHGKFHMLNALDVPTQKFSDSTGALEGILL